MKLPRLALVALLFACTFPLGCKTGEPWAFAVTRSVNESGVDEELLQSSQDFRHGEQLELAVILAPFVIDLALLPVTLAHDAVACK
jgi:hypothetical protein